MKYKGHYLMQLNKTILQLSNRYTHTQKEIFKNKLQIVVRKYKNERSKHIEVKLFLNDKVRELFK